jgi:septum formation protein
MPPRQLVLSSTSPARQALLKRLQMPFEIADPKVDEKPLTDETAEQLVLRLAKEKALASAISYPNAIIIGADQVGTLDHHILGKPLTHENAVRQLQQVSGRRVQFLTGMCVLDAKTQRCLTELDTMDVIFRQLTLSMIENYLYKERPYHCAGSAQIEGLGISLVSELQGKDFTSLIGLPLITLTQMLEQMGAGPLDNK